jgi:hypothetical protein
VAGLADATREAGKYEAQVTRLAVSLANQGENTAAARNALQTYARELTSVSLATETQILGALAQAKALGASDEAAKNLTRAATDLSAATGVDMDTAFRQVNKTLGGYAGELGEIFPELKTLTQEQLQAGEAAAILTRQVGGAGEAIAGTYEGSVNNLNSALTQLRVEVGGPVSDVLTALNNDILIPLVSSITSNQSVMATWKNIVLDLAISAVVAAQGLRDLVSALPESGAGQAATTFFEGLKLNVIELGSALGIQGAEMAKTRRIIEDMAPAQLALFNQSFIDNLEGSGSALDTFLASLLKLREGTVETADPLDEIKNKVRETGDAARDALANIEGLLGAEPAAPGDAGAMPDAGNDLLASVIAQGDLIVEAERDVTDQIREIRLAGIVGFTEERAELELEALNARYEAEIEAADALGQDTTGILKAWDLERTQAETKQAEARKQIAKAEAAAKQKTVMAMAGAVLGTLGGLFGESKAIAIAGALLNTYESVTQALKQPPGVPYTIPFGVLAGVMGFAQVQKIRSTQAKGFQFGGIVTGGTAGRDSVPILATPGEAILPTELTDFILGGGGAGDINVEVEMGPNIQNLADAINVKVRTGEARLLSSQVVGARTPR